MSLDTFIQRSKPLPKPVCTSRTIQDRDSIFLATLFRITSPVEAMAATKCLRNVIHNAKPADHKMMAYRVMALKSGRSGLDDPNDFEVQVGFDDDGEKYGGERILKVMNREGILDAVIVVSRWFGGTLLGPVRFTHIEHCAQDVCTQFKITEEMERYIEQLRGLDQKLANSRGELVAIEGGEAPREFTPQDYSSLLESLDSAKARRLVKAREGAIASVQMLIEKRSKALASSTFTADTCT